MLFRSSKKIKNQIWAESADAEAVYENITEVSDMNKALFAASGSNEQARKKSGVEACMNHKTAEGETVNLFSLRAEARSRYMFYKAAMLKLKTTQELLVGIQAMLKIEKTVVNGEV